MAEKHHSVYGHPRNKRKDPRHGNREDEKRRRKRERQEIEAALAEVVEAPAVVTGTPWSDFDNCDPIGDLYTTYGDSGKYGREVIELLLPNDRRHPPELE